LAEAPATEGDEIVITSTSGLPGGDAMTARVKSIGADKPFPITVTTIS
jgi:hypothetical protein